jgi:hypothetical protein
MKNIATTAAHASAFSWPTALYNWNIIVWGWVQENLKTSHNQHDDYREALMKISDSKTLSDTWKFHAMITISLKKFQSQIYYG